MYKRQVVITATPAVETYTVESAAGWAVLSQSYKVLRVDAEAPAGLVRIDGAQADAPDVYKRQSHGMAFETILDGFYKAVPRA